MKLILGTAQLGLNYGISNTLGAMPQATAHRILKTAQQHNITALDTAYHYGDAESIIGHFHLKTSQDSRAHNPFQIISKARHFSNATHIGNHELIQLKQQLSTSLQTLNIQNFHAILIHQLADLQKPGGLALWQTLTEHPTVLKTGVSIYSAKDIDWVLAYLNPDIIQVPFNLLDQRLLESGHLDKIKQRSIEIHARSIFLQGLLLMPLAEIETKHPKALPWIKTLHHICRELNITPLNLALSFGLQHPQIDRILVGVQNEQELLELYETSKNPSTLSCKKDLLKKMCCDELAVIDPRVWNFV